MEIKPLPTGAAIDTCLILLALCGEPLECLWLKQRL
jgi:hypothetical protein